MYVLSQSAYFFLEYTTDRHMELLPWVMKFHAHCTGPKRLPEPPQNRICNRLLRKVCLFPAFQ